MNPSFFAIEVFIFVLFGLCLWHALRIGRHQDKRYDRSWAPLAAMIGTFLFTWLLEARLGDPSNPSSIYSYPQAFIAQGRLTLGVPLWIPLGWSFVVYVAMRTSDKLEPSWKVRPVLDGLLALVLDFTLDPIAVLNRWWFWKTEQLYVFSAKQLRSTEQTNHGLDCVRDMKVRILQPAADVRGPGVNPGEELDKYNPAWIPADLVARECRPWTEPGYSDFFGIPLRNFFAWFFIVVAFSFFFRWLRHRWLRPRGRTGFGWELLAAGLAIVPSGIVITIYKWASEQIGASNFPPAEGVVLFTLLWVGAILLVAKRWFTYRHDLPFDRFLWLTPLALQAFFFFELFVRKGHLLMPELAVFMPMVATVGVFVFGWPYLDDMKRIVETHGWRRLFAIGAGLREHRR